MLPPNAIKRSVRLLKIKLVVFATFCLERPGIKTGPDDHLLPGNWPAGGRGAGQVWSHARSSLRSNVRNSTAIGSRKALADPCWWDALEAVRREERLRGEGGGRVCSVERREQRSLRKLCVCRAQPPFFAPRPPLPLFRHDGAPSHGSLMVARESCKLETVMFPLTSCRCHRDAPPFPGKGGDHQRLSRDVRCKFSFFPFSFRVDKDDGRVVSSDDRQQTENNVWMPSVTPRPQSNTNN